MTGRCVDRVVCLLDCLVLLRCLGRDENTQRSVDTAHGLCKDRLVLLSGLRVADIRQVKRLPSVLPPSLLCLSVCLSCTSKKSASKSEP